MSNSNERSLRGLSISLAALSIFALMFFSQLGGGPNVGGVFPAPILVIGLVGMPISGLFVLGFGVAAIFSRSKSGENPHNDKS
jgi:hypothetical protein